MVKVGPDLRKGEKRVITTAGERRVRQGDEETRREGGCREMRKICRRWRREGVATIGGNQTQRVAGREAEDKIKSAEGVGEIETVPA